MQLPLLTEDAYSQLEASIKENSASFYERDEPWIDEYFQSIEWDGAPLRMSSLRMPDVSLVHDAMLNPAQDDLSNAKRLYDGLHVLTPLQASQPLLWAALAHQTYYTYCVSRWRSVGGDRWIQRRMFVQGTSTRGLYEHAIARLWWYSHLTYVKEADNPYKYTELLLLNERICSDVLHFNLSQNRALLLSLLDALDRYRIDHSDKNISNIWRNAIVRLNRYGGAICIASLPADTIQELMHSFLCEAYNEQ